MQLPATTQQLLITATVEELYLAMINQLNKDFGLANLSYSFSLGYRPDQLSTAWENVIHDLLESNYDGYLNLIYRVDLSEKDLLNLKSNSLRELSAELTYLILKRIYKKVWFRNRL